MSYIESNLLPGEQVKIKAEASWLARPLLLAEGLFFAIAGLGGLMVPKDGSSASDSANMMIGVSFLISTYIYFSVKSIELAATDKRVISKFGIISRKTIELSISKIESVQVKQSITGRILGYGSVIISGAGNTQNPIAGIRRPNEFKNKLNALIHSVNT